MNFVVSSDGKKRASDKECRMTVIQTKINDKIENFLRRDKSLNNSKFTKTETGDFLLL